MEIRPIRTSDTEATLAIYNAAVEAGTANLDHLTRTAEQQREWIVAHLGAYPGIVAHEGDDVLGFAAVSPYNERTGYTTTVENSIYVAPHAQGRGIGRELLTAMCEVAADTGYHSVIARIIAGNDASVRLHTACGFEQIGIEREIGRKQSKWFDVVVMQRIFDADR